MASSTKVLGAPAVIGQSAAKPVVIASGNGNVYRNGGSETCVELAFRRMMAGDDVLDSLIAGVNIVELDPAESGVGWIPVVCMGQESRRAVWRPCKG